MSWCFFQNQTCEYFPCHTGIAVSEFNCLFCYCPLYTLGRDCGGTFRYLENGVKSCEDCTLPHLRENVNLVLSRFPELAELAGDHSSGGNET